LPIFPGMQLFSGDMAFVTDLVWDIYLSCQFGHRCNLVH
jgi:hypothetical protein